jgi:alpha-glucosidase (family GH31 glycosyl hydrolase)
VRFILLLLLVAAGCGKPLPDSWTLASGALTLTVRRAPYSFTVSDHTGKIVLSSLGAGKGDGYGALGWTSGQVYWNSAASMGYYLFDTQLDPWRDQLRIESATRTGDTLVLVASLPNQPGTLHIKHSVSGGRLRVEADVNSVNKPVRAWQAAFATPADEHFIGFGERYGRVDQRGHAVYAWPEEGGLATGEGTRASATNPWPNGEEMTYYPVPFFLSTAGYGFWLDSDWRNELDMASDRPDAWRAWHIGPSLAFEIYLPTPGDARPWPYQVLDQFTARTGRPLVPPSWSFGPRRRIGSNDKVNGVNEIQAMRDNQLAITVVDDNLHFAPDGNDLGQEKALQAWVQSANAIGYKVVGYYNPYFSKSPSSPLFDQVQKAISNNWFLQNSDGTLSDVWLISGKPLDVYTVDLTDAAARDWFTGTFKRALALGYSGWMYDFGEYVQPGVVSHSGVGGEALHNQFPRLYDQAAHDALEQLDPGDYYFFARSGYTGSSQYTPMVWSGDPDASFDDAEGLPAQVRAGINLSLSGVAHWGSDISGFKCVADGSQAADGELVTRWIEFGAMSSNMHDENACSGGTTPKANIWSSADAQAAWRTYANLHSRLLPYWEALAQTAHQTGAPVMRSLYLEHPDRPELAPVADEFYFGPALLVAPVVTRGARTRTLALPPGVQYLDWRDQQLVRAADVNSVNVMAPLDKLPLFLREGQLVPLLDASIETLMIENNATVIGPTDVADVYDVVGLLTGQARQARFTFADGTSLAADYTSAFAPPAGLTPAAAAADLATCGGCYLMTVVTPGLTRVQISAAAGAPLAAGGLQLAAAGVTRRLRWDLYLAD